MEKTVSVIVPVYNTPYLLVRKCLNSLIRQSYKNIEILVINDGSREDYSDIQKEYETKDSRIKFYNKENGGAASARNFGIEKSKGDYISFVDADDYVDGFFIEGLLDAIEGADISICGVCGMTFPTEGSYNDHKTFFYLPSHFNGVQYMNFSVNKLYKAEIIKENNIRFPEGIKMGEDALFLAQYYKHCRFIRSIPEFYYYYIYNNNSAMTRYNPEYWEWEEKVLKADWELFNQNPLSEREMFALLHWVYEKTIGALRYYCEKEEDKDKLMSYCNQIRSNEIVKKLFECDFNRDMIKHFRKKEIRVIAGLQNCSLSKLKKLVIRKDQD